MLVRFDNAGPDTYYVRDSFVPSVRDADCAAQIKSPNEDLVWTLEGDADYSRVRVLRVPVDGTF